MTLLPLITSASVVCATVFALCAPFWLFGIPFSSQAAVSAFLLALPLLSVGVAQWRMRGRPHVSDLMLLLVAFVLWYHCAFLMAWFHPGLYGAAFLGIVSAAPMMFLILLVHRATRDQAAPQSTASSS